jgi:hypothetical protein
MVDKNATVTIIDKNILVANLAFSIQDYTLMNIIGNRIMSDAVFLEDKESVIIGYCIKQVSLSYLSLRPHIVDAELVNAKKDGEKYLSGLIELKPGFTMSKLWSDYHDFNINIMKYRGSDTDKKIKEIYGDDAVFTGKVREWAVDFLSNNKDALTQSKNNMIKGIMNEFQRAGLSCGYEIKDTVVFSCLLALDRYYEYFVIEHSNPGEKLDRQTVETKLFGYIDTIKEIAKSTEIKYDIVTDLMWKLIKGWRELFIVYGELPNRISEKPMELSKDTKTKLSEVVNKALQKELKPLG